MNTTTFVVCGFHRGRKLKPQHFNTEAQARECAAYMSGTLDCVVLTTSDTQSAMPYSLPPEEMPQASATAQSWMEA